MVHEDETTHWSDDMRVSSQIVTISNHNKQENYSKLTLVPDNGQALYSCLR